jgi:hypothetical protein
LTMMFAKVTLHTTVTIGNCCTTTRFNAIVDHNLWYNQQLLHTTVKIDSYSERRRFANSKAHLDHSCINTADINGILRDRVLMCLGDLAASAIVLCRHDL